jgi:hypothetical protein
VAQYWRKAAFNKLLSSDIADSTFVYEKNDKIGDGAVSIFYSFFIHFFFDLLFCLKV